MHVGFSGYACNLSLQNCCTSAYSEERLSVMELSVVPYKSVNGFRFGMSYLEARELIQGSYKAAFPDHSDIPHADVADDCRLFYDKNGRLKTVMFSSASSILVNGKVVDIAGALLHEPCVEAPSGFGLRKEGSTCEFFSTRLGLIVDALFDGLRSPDEDYMVIAFSRATIWFDRCCFLDVLLKLPWEGDSYEGIRDWVFYDEFGLACEDLCLELAHDRIFVSKADYCTLKRVGENNLANPIYWPLVPIRDAYPSWWDDERIRTAELEVATAPDSKLGVSFYWEREGSAKVVRDCYVGVYDGLEIAVTTDGNEVLWSRPVEIAGYEKPFFDSL